jgi:hypothetical protein
MTSPDRCRAGTTDHPTEHDEDHVSTPNPRPTAVPTAVRQHPRSSTPPAGRRSTTCGTAHPTDPPARGLILDPDEVGGVQPYTITTPTHRSRG